MKFILASTSPYRRKQLKDFGLRFQSIAPNFDEESYKHTKVSPTRLCQTLAFRKAESIAKLYPDAAVLGGDQLISFRGQVLGKPLTAQKAQKMLKMMSAKEHKLITCICLIYKKKAYRATVIAKIKMRKLTAHEIRAYIKRDRPLNCAGSYKFEKSGLSLVEKIQVSDPSSLTGVPLISLNRILLKLS